MRFRQDGDVPEHRWRTWDMRETRCSVHGKSSRRRNAISSMLCNREVAKEFTAGTHGSTYGGHCVTCAAGLASVTEILDNNLSENAKEMGEYMKQELAKLPHVKEARGRGLLVGCEYDIPIAVEVKHGCLDRMALITAIGDSVNRMIPPLIVTKKQIDELMLIMRASIEDAAAKY